MNTFLKILDKLSKQCLSFSPRYNNKANNCWETLFKKWLLLNIKYALLERNKKEARI